MAESNLQVSVRNQCAIVALNRPDVRNAFDDKLIANLTQAFREIDEDDSIRAMILMGNGSAFCAGADLNWMKRMAGFSEKQNFNDAMGLGRMMYTLYHMRKPTIARVHGPAFAGGTGLVAACDIAVGTPDAVFALTESKLGLSPATVSPYVIRAMGERAAHRYFLTGERFDAAEAYRLGLLTELCQPEELDHEINAMLGHVIAGGKEALRQIKTLIRDVADRRIDEALVRDTSQRIASIRASREGREGVSAFLEKREPAWMRTAKAKPAVAKKVASKKTTSKVTPAKKSKPSPSKRHVRSKQKRTRV